MLRIGIVFIFGTFLGITLFNVVIKNQLEPKVLSESALAQETIPSSTPETTPEVTPTPTTEPEEVKSTPTPTPEKTSVPSPTPKPTPTEIPQPTYSSAEINNFIERFASQYSIDANVLRHIAVCESGFRPFAKNGAYFGLYQFGPITWSNYRKLMGEDPHVSLRLNAEEAIQTAAYALSLGKRHLWPNCAP